MRTQSETSKLLKARENANDKDAFFSVLHWLVKKSWKDGATVETKRRQNGGADTLPFDILKRITKAVEFRSVGMNSFWSKPSCSLLADVLRNVTKKSNLAFYADTKITN